MSVQTPSWETRLIALATEALSSPVLDETGDTDGITLKTAYNRCAAITQESSRTFYMASHLLPEHKRHAARALYAFCRVTDDIVDESDDPHAAYRELMTWRNRVNSLHFSADDLVPVAWNDTQARFGIPRGYAEQLIEGVKSDLTIKRYDTFEQLSEYCYGAASTVGLMVMHLVGFRGEHTLPYAVKLGVALQLTNILRDIHEDWDNGRLYLPQEDLAAFGLSEADIAAQRHDDQWKAFMRFQIERTRRLYAEARPGIGLLNRDGRFAIAAASDLYEGILDDIEANDYQVFNRRAHLTTWGKVRRLPAIWLRANRA